MRRTWNRTFIPLLAAWIAAWPLVQREANTRAATPPFSQTNQTFTLVNVPVSQVNPIPVGLAGGLMVFVKDEGNCGRASLRVLADPTRVQTVLGSPIPADGYVLLTREPPHLFNPSTNTCDIPNPAFSTLGNSQPNFGPAGIHSVGAADLNANTTRVLVTYIRSEGGCEPGGGDCCTPSDGAVDLNGDGDLFDGVVQYAQLIIDKPTGNVTSVSPMVNTGFIAESIFLANNGRLIAGLTQESSLRASCSAGGNCMPGQIFCPWISPGVDLNGDGFVGGTVLRLYDVDTQVTTNTALSMDVAPPCPPAFNTTVYPEIALPPGQQPFFVLGDGLLAFATRESPPIAASSPCLAKAGRDLNGDGDFTDLVVRYIQLNGSLTTVLPGPTLSQNTENTAFPGSSAASPDAGLLGTAGSRIAFALAESPDFIGPTFPPCNDPRDLNQNCNGGDAVLQMFDASDMTLANLGVANTFVNLGLGPLTHTRFHQGLAVFVSPESREGPMNGTDLNCDGDTRDEILRIADLNTGLLVNTRVPIIDRDSFNNDLFRRVPLGTDGQIALFEDFPIVNTGLPIAPIHYIRVNAGSPAAACGSSTTTTTPAPTTTSVPPTTTTTTTTTLPPTTTTTQPPTTTTLPPTTTTQPPTTTTLPPTTTTLPPTTTTLPPPTTTTQPPTTTTLPPTTTTTTSPTTTTTQAGPLAGIDSLITQVSNLNLDKGQKNSLLAKLNAARDSVLRGNNKAAANQLQAFVNEVEALKKTQRLTAATADSLIARARSVISQL